MNSSVDYGPTCFAAPSTAWMAPPVGPEVRSLGPPPQLSEALRTAFMGHVEAWLGEMQRLIHGEVEKHRQELLAEVATKRQQLDAEWASLISERESMQQEHAALVVKEEALDREKSAMLQGASPHSQPTEILELNVGGQMCCAVKRATLCRIEHSVLGSMFSGRWEASLERDPQCRIFIDFPPDLFMPLVDYLRQKSIEDPTDPVEPPEIPPERLTAFKRMLTYYGLADTIWPRPEGKWEVAWGQIQIDEEDRSITVSAQRDTYQAAAYNTMRLKRSPNTVWKMVISKTRADVPWYYDSVAFGIVNDRGRHAGGTYDSDLQATASDLMLNLRGGIVGEDFPNDSIDLGGMPAEEAKLHVEVKVKSGRLILSFNGREHVSIDLQRGQQVTLNSEANVVLLVAVTYPWIKAQLCPV